MRFLFQQSGPFSALLCCNYPLEIRANRIFLMEYLREISDLLIAARASDER
jgi:hypothetical protein